MAAVVDSLLAEHKRSARSESGVVVAVDIVLAQQTVEWDPAFRRAHRKLVRDGSVGLMAMSTPGGLAQVVATLIDNALVHGAGTVTVHPARRVATSCSRFAMKAPVVPDELVPHIFERSFSGAHRTGLGSRSLETS